MCKMLSWIDGMMRVFVNSKREGKKMRLDCIEDWDVCAVI